MKKALLPLTILIAVVTVFTVFTGSVFAASSSKITEKPDIKIVLDREPVECKNVPIVVNGSTLLPLRELAVILGVPNDDQHIIYEPSNRSVTILKDSTKVTVYIGKLNAYVNDESKSLDTIPILYGKKNDITYIPFRFVAEALGWKVVWDAPSQSILLCDPVKFGNVKAIMDKVSDEFKKVSKCKMNIGLSIDVKAKAVSTKMGISASSEIDNVNKKMHMLMNMDLLGIKIETDSYYADNALYTLEPFSGGWQKQVFTKPEYERMFASESSGDVFKSDDTLCAGLDQVESSNGNEMLLKGNMLSSSLYKGLLNGQKLGYGTDAVKGAVNEDFIIEISIDKSTYLVNSVILTMKSEKTENNVDTDVNMTAEVKYSEYNGSFEVVVPQEVIDNAVETAKTTKLQ